MGSVLGEYGVVKHAHCGHGSCIMAQCVEHLVLYRVKGRVRALRMQGSARAVHLWVPTEGGLLDIWQGVSPTTLLHACLVY
jgi:hypothetical protein